MSTFTMWAARSHVGKVRAVNEDSAYAGRWLYAVADGMGGHAAGEVASATVITALSGYDALAPTESLVEILSQAVREANTAIRQRTEADPALRTMGTTLTAMLWSGRAFALAHIGDSRAYLLRDGRFRQLTEDHALHNLVAGAAASPVLAPIMSRYLDGRPDRSPDLALRQAQPGDRYLLCSDGLNAVVFDDTVREALKSAEDPASIAERLISLALNRGGPDNITVTLIDVTARPQEGTLTTHHRRSIAGRSHFWSHSPAFSNPFAEHRTRPQPKVTDGPDLP
jgi:PPM family protein phosphatase